ncbi:cytochrome P450 [Mycena alexandri]|uniref:Cytochrome P450 n=1 Tax=Mycena alexandri TaxID=1745969 RepID=A0AAD6SFQ4_9AGAR|nr:cytochrome P450 [Mycena alexandri]
MLPVFVSFLLVVGTGVLLYILRSRTPHLKPPRGPPRDPFIWHLRSMPTAQSGLVFHRWAKTYGDVMQLDVFRQRIIVLDTHQAAADLLDKRSLIYSDRPEFPLYNLLGWTHILGFMQYDKTFVKHRQIHQSYLSRQKCVGFLPMQTEEARRLARNLVISPPERYSNFLSRFSTSVITRLTVGHEIVSDDDPYLELTKTVYEAVSRTGPPGNSPLDLFPFLQHFPSWFPGAYHAGVARAWKPAVRKLYEYSLQSVESERVGGRSIPSFLLSWLEESESNASVVDREEVKGVVATMFAAGEATTWSVVTLFILAMVLHPDSQLKAQNELDSVLGGARLPEFRDRESLLYIDCIVQETLRWHPATPLGIPHRCTQDDEYRGMHIAKGSLVFANIRGMSLDESVYKDATIFRPERFLPVPLGNGEPHFTSAFGFGRRICTGRHLADNSLWIAIATILATCSISNALDANGEKIIPELVMSDGLASHPDDFPCVITARSPAVEALLAEGPDSPAGPAV